MGLAPASAQAAAEVAAKVAERRLRFEIPAQNAAGALREVARQSGRQILFPFDTVGGRRAPALFGLYTPAQAAERLGAAVGLTVRSVDGRTITLGPAEASAPPPVAVARAPLRPPKAAPVAAPAPLAPPPAAPPGLLQEVVVTATRQTELLNQVPISLTAATQRTLDQLGVRQAADMQTVTPALVFSQLTPGVANVAIRGVTDTGSGAATTGFYLDDTPLQKRNAGGVRTGSGNGTPLPPLFDVERVEVLRGPQGTLFGAGSEGGTIRYISPQASLDRPTAYARAEASTTARGDPSVEAGVAFGAPIVQDRLGFRVSLFERRTGGFLDYIDPYTKRVRFEDANSGRSRLMRLQLLWAPTDRLRATFALTSTGDRWASATSSYTPSMPAPIVVPTQCFDTTGASPAAPQNNPTPVSCASRRITFVRPGITYGPYPDTGPGSTLVRDRTPSSTNLRVPSLTLEYVFDTVTAKSITSYVSDQTRYVGLDNLSQVRDSRSNADYGGIYIPRGFTLAGEFPDAWRADGHFESLNRRYGLSQELRFASLPEAKPFSWVAGVFYSNLRTRQRYDNVYPNLDLLARTLYGLSAEQRYGVPAYGLNGVPFGFDHKDQAFQDVEIAGFGEINFQATDRLKLIAGVRVSRLYFTYVEHHYGPASGFNNPTPANGGGPNGGSTTESPVAPKLGAQWRFSQDDMVYVTAAKGFRAGGVNANLPAAICGPGLAQYGLQPNDIPATYQSDKVWSYEAGAKLRLLDGRLQLNGAAYRIDWTNAQIAIDVGNNCGIPFIGNAGTARSQGVEIEAQAKVGRRITADFALGYDDVRYTENAVAVRAGTAPLIVAVKDQRLAIPPLTLRLGGRYDFAVAGLKAYARADWYYTKGYDHAAQQTYGLPAYSPDAVIQNVRRANLRIGIESGGIEASLFANNLFNTSAGMITGGRSGCALPAAGGDAACRTYGTYNPFLAGAPAAAPRQVGLQVTYRR